MTLGGKALVPNLNSKLNNNARLKIHYISCNAAFRLTCALSIRYLLTCSMLIGVGGLQI